MAVDRNARVMKMVEEAIWENPDVSNEELQKRAAEIDPRIGELSPRSFNARYPLQVKRKLSAQKEKEEGGEQAVNKDIREDLDVRSGTRSLTTPRTWPRPRTAAR